MLKNYMFKFKRKFEKKVRYNFQVFLFFVYGGNGEEPKSATFL